MASVSIHMSHQAQPVIHTNVVNSYEKGSFYVIYEDDEMVYKYPIQHIWRVIEEYGEHRG